MRNEHRVVITGIGAVMPGGMGREAAWKACLEGKPGTGPIRAFDATGFPVGVAGEVADEDLFPRLPEEKVDKVDRFAALAMVAAREALDDAGLDAGEKAEEIGVYVGSGFSGRRSIDRQNAALYRGGARRVHPRLMQNNITNAASGEVAIDLGLKGPNLAFSVGCSSASHAMIQAVNALRLGRMAAVLVGGAEAPILPLVLEEMQALCEMSRRREDPARISAPFDRERDGFVAAEGSCFLILERLDGALSRGARIYAELKGGSVRYDRDHFTERDSAADGMADAMRVGLIDTGALPDRVDYVCASGLSTRRDDVDETRAIREVFGDSADQLLVSSVKGVTGYAISASETFDVAICALALRRGTVPPTGNLTVPGRGCDLDFVPGSARAAELRVALSNSFGIDGNHSTIVLERFDG